MKESMQETFQSPPLNSNSIIGFIAAILTMVSFCIGLAPIPFTALICDPLSLIAGTFALVTGMKALRQIRQTGESGRTFALISAWTGGTIILATLCVLTLGILLFPYFIDFIKTLWHNLINLS
jgi:hypothetical protein